MAPKPEMTIAAECLALRLRTVHRVVSALYDQALRPHSLRIGQLSLLVAIACLGQARPQDLCHALKMDKSTLSRDLAALKRRGWIVILPAQGRTRPLSLSPAGHALLARCLPAWRKAQNQTQTLLGDSGAELIHQLASRILSPIPDPP